MKVVLIDDSHAVQRSFGSLLASVAHVDVVGCAESVADALALIERQMPDLVVLDVELRGGELGTEVLKHVVRAYPGMQVIVLSNFTWRAMRQELLAAGAHAYFDKSNEFALARDWIAARAASAYQGTASP